VKNKNYFWCGVILLVLLVLAYFIKFNVDSGDNYVVRDSLLGVLIFHNPFILGLYILIIVALLFRGKSALSLNSSKVKERKR